MDEVKQFFMNGKKEARVYRKAANDRYDEFLIDGFKRDRKHYRKLLEWALSAQDPDPADIRAWRLNLARAEGALIGFGLRIKPYSLQSSPSGEAVATRRSTQLAEAPTAAASPTS